MIRGQEALFFGVPTISFSLHFNLHYPLSPIISGPYGHLHHHDSTVYFPVIWLRTNKQRAMRQENHNRLQAIKNYRAVRVQLVTHKLEEVLIFKNQDKCTLMEFALVLKNVTLALELASYRCCRVRNGRLQVDGMRRVLEHQQVTERTH